jgi:putative membrane protein
VRWRATTLLLLLGVILFVALIASQGVEAVLKTLSLAGWGLIAVALFHLLPLLLDALSIRVLLIAPAQRGSYADAVLARWTGESANSLMPAGVIGGPVLIARQLAQRGVVLPEAAAAVTVSTTLQAFAQVIFALIGLLMLFARRQGTVQHALSFSLIVAAVVLVLPLGLFYLVQRRGLFAGLVRWINRFAGKHDWTTLITHAQEIDAAIERSYGKRGRIAASFGLSLLAWIVGTGEVYLIVRLIGLSISWSDALLLESLGQAVRGAAFAIPAALGVQEGGYLLLGPLVGLPADAALALSLAKRAREILLGVPGLLYLHHAERLAATR